MITRKAILVSVGVLSLAAFCVPAMADDWSFGFSYGHGPRYYPAPRTYVYRDYSPVYYRTYAPEVVSYNPPPRFYYFRDYAPRTTVVYRDHGPRYFRSSTTYMRSSEPTHRAYRQYGHGGTRVRAHARW